jgi:hypothetical protein
VNAHFLDFTDLVLAISPPARLISSPYPITGFRQISRTHCMML